MGGGGDFFVFIVQCAKVLKGHLICYAILGYKINTVLRQKFFLIHLDD